MKKVLLTAGFAVFMVIALSAQTKEAPPPPPTPPATAEPTEPPPPPAPPPSPANDDYDAFLERNSSVKSLSWTKKNELIVRLKSGKEEKYNLTEEKSVKAAEDKYGQLPASPPPPPPAPPPPPKLPKKTLS